MARCQFEYGTDCNHPECEEFPPPAEDLVWAHALGVVRAHVVQRDQLRTQQAPLCDDDEARPQGASAGGLNALWQLGPGEVRRCAICAARLMAASRAGDRGLRPQKGRA
jgi:hypothetical protein